MRSLERIEKKLDKESDSNKTESRENSKRKRRVRSISRHHRHSPKHSNKEAHSSSIPSPTIKHRKLKVDELKGEMNKIKPPTFDREHKKDEYAETWLLGMRKYF
jgi:hypothetical protein